MPEYMPDKRRTKMKKEIILYVVVAILAILLIGGLFSVKAEGKRSYFSEKDIPAEQEYIGRVKEVLSEYHINNASITLNKISEDGTYTEYTVKIHTGINNSEEMIEKLEGLSPEVEGATVDLIIS